MKLKHEKQIVYWVKEEDLAAFVKEHLGIEYDFMKVENPYFESELEFWVAPHEDDRLQAAADSILKTGEVPSNSTSLLLDELCTRGLILSGYYHIEVDL